MALRRIILFISILFFYITVFSQTEDAWVYFLDKPNSNDYFNNPTEMLSQRSLDRRENQGISLDIKDVPLYTDYVNQIENASGIEIIAKSKWLNCVHVQGLQSDIEALESLGFVVGISYANTSLNAKIIQSESIKTNQNKLDVATDFNYGNAYNQINMIGGNYLHNLNFTGQTMQIAVIDAGFTNVDTMGAFERIYTNNQVLGTYNFIERDTDVYFRSTHGTKVLSTLAGYIEDTYVGTAPDASYYLFITEDSNQEHPYEESLWVEAAERADSLGVDVLTTSLGYTEFDRTAYNHTYADLDGQTTFITRGAEIAFSRGMLVVNSAGNSGNKAWHYIGAPADAPSILSIGAVDANEQLTAFSSWGPTADGRVKPDVCAQGGSAAVINTSNSIVNASGTSFSGPILAGVATCFWQAFPNKTNAQIAQTIRESAHLFLTPEDQFGYGIPNFETAFTTLKNESLEASNWWIFPNPITSQESIHLNFNQNNTSKKYTIRDVSGKIIKTGFLIPGNNLIPTINLSDGLYFITLTFTDRTETRKIIIKK